MKTFLTRPVAVFAGLVAIIAGGATWAAVAASASTPVFTGTLVVCWNPKTHEPTTWKAPHLCPSGQVQAQVNGRGPRGPRGIQGQQGIQGLKGDTGQQGIQGVKGDTGPSGVVAAHTSNLGPLASVPTGGSFNATTGAVEVGTVNLPAGTFLVSLNAKATPRASGDTAQIFPQFFVYNQVKNPGFAGDLFNVGAGALEPDGTNHDSYFSGDSLITLASPTTLHVYAFGYDSDSGAGSYVLDGLTITTIQVTPAG